MFSSKELSSDGMPDHDDKANNDMQGLIQVQFLNGQPTAISPGTLRYISRINRDDKEQDGLEVKS